MPRNPAYRNWIQAIGQDDELDDYEEWLDMNEDEFEAVEGLRELLSNLVSEAWLTRRLGLWLFLRSHQ